MNSSSINKDFPFRAAIMPILLIFVLSFSLFGQGNDTESVLNEISRLITRRSYNEALALINALPSQDASSTAFLLMKASILNSAGKPAEARATANIIIAREPNNTDALMILADAAAIEGKDRDRRNALEQVLKINPSHARALTDLGNISLGTRNLRTAASYFDQALASEPNNGEALLGRASVYRYSDDPFRAEQLLNRAITLYPQWARPYHERARLYKGFGFLEDAMRDFDAAKALEPDNYWILVDRGVILFEIGRSVDALEEFTHAIAVDPSSFLAYVYSAGIKDETGDYAGAAKDYETLSKLRPDYYYAFEGLGIIRMRNHQWALARDAFLDAYKQAPKEYSYVLLATVNWMRAGRQTDPRQFLTQVLRTVPRDSIEYYVIKLFYDLSGDMDVSKRVEAETNLNKKSSMLFYLGCYNDIRGNKNLAGKYFLMVKEMNRIGTIEWRINEFILEELGIRSF